MREARRPASRVGKPECLVGTPGHLHQNQAGQLYEQMGFEVTSIQMTKRLD